MAREHEQPNLAKLEDLLAHLKPESETGHLRLVSPEGEEVELPELVFRLMHQLVSELAQGNSVTILASICSPLPKSFEDKRKSVILA